MLTDVHKAAPSSQPESLALPLARTGGILLLQPRINSAITYLAAVQGFLKCNQSALHLAQVSTELHYWLCESDKVNLTPYQLAKPTSPDFHPSTRACPTHSHTASVPLQTDPVLLTDPACVPRTPEHLSC